MGLFDRFKKKQDQQAMPPIQAPQTPGQIDTPPPLDASFPQDAGFSGFSPLPSAPKEDLPMTGQATGSNDYPLPAEDFGFPMQDGDAHFPTDAFSEEADLPALPEVESFPKIELESKQPLPAPQAMPSSPPPLPKETPSFSPKPSQEDDELFTLFSKPSSSPSSTAPSFDYQEVLPQEEEQEEMPILQPTPKVMMPEPMPARKSMPAPMPNFSSQQKPMPMQKRAKATVMPKKNVYLTLDHYHVLAGTAVEVTQTNLAAGDILFRLEDLNGLKADAYEQWRVALEQFQGKVNEADTLLFDH